MGSSRPAGADVEYRMSAEGGGSRLRRDAAVARSGLAGRAVGACVPQREPLASLRRDAAVARSSCAVSGGWRVRSAARASCERAASTSGAGGNRTLVRRAVSVCATTIPEWWLTVATLPGQVVRGCGPSVGSFPDVSGLSHCQWSLPTVLHRFCCRAAVNWPRVPLPVAMSLVYLIGIRRRERQGRCRVFWLPRFGSLSNSGRTRRVAVSTSKPISP